MALTWPLERDGSTGEDVKTVQYLSDETQLNSRAFAAANSSAVSSPFSNIAPSASSRSVRSALLLLGGTADGVAALILAADLGELHEQRPGACVTPAEEMTALTRRSSASYRSMSSPRLHHYMRPDGAAIPLAGPLTGLASVDSPHVLTLDSDTGD
jgi:hypothetical protein